MEVLLLLIFSILNKHYDQDCQEIQFNLRLIYKDNHNFNVAIPVVNIPSVALALLLGMIRRCT